ncbi:MAG: hypothetical protein ACFFE2_00520 [Candidatus Thorarchaeota archaeon]
MAIHPVFVHFHTGILTATAAVALVNLLLRILFRDNINTPGTRLSKIFHQFDVFIYVGGIIGLLGLFAGALTGFMDEYTFLDLVESSIMRFKILWSVVSMEIYVYLIIVRARLGDRVWVKASTYFPYAILVIFGGVLMMIMGALGGIFVYDTSILKPILDWIGIPWP